MVSASVAEPGAGSLPAVLQSPRAIAYLCFQGGGGKGFAYLGALDWLEKNGAPLPISQKTGLRGVSGASAGAITALFVALGYSAQQIQAICLDPKLTIATLVDEAELGVFRCVSKDPRGIITFPPTASAIGPLVALGSLQWAIQLFAPQPGSLGWKLLATTPRYWQCIVSDCGMISGVNIRKWLRDIIAQSPLIKKKQASALLAGGRQLTFQDLYNLGDMRTYLAIAGTNITSGRPVIFSTTSTPNLSVADAVAISASLPPVFKPVWVSASAPISAKPSSVTGWYVDGGLVNNLPMHVFDGGTLLPFDPYADPQFQAGNEYQMTSQGTTTTPLNPGMLALRLTPGDRSDAPPGASSPDPPTKPPSLRDVSNQLLGAATFGANMGQIRSPEEGKQTVLIYTDGLGLLDFVPRHDGSAQKAFDDGAVAMTLFYRHATL